MSYSNAIIKQDKVNSWAAGLPACRGNLAFPYYSHGDVMNLMDDFITRATEQKQADSDRLTGAAFRNIYTTGIEQMANDEPLSGQGLEHFRQACSVLGKDAGQIQADVDALKARREAQTIADRAGSTYVKAATVRAQFAAAGISPLRDTPGYRDSLSAQMQEAESELAMLRQAESLLAQHEPMSTTADGLPGEIAIHEAAHVAIGIALGCKLESVALQGRNGITIFSEGVDGDIQQAAVMLAGSVGVAKVFNQPAFSHLSKQDGLNLLRLLGDDPHCVRSMRRAERLAQFITVANEGTIIAIARKLEQHGRLSAADIQAELDSVDDWQFVKA